MSLWLITYLPQRIDGGVQWVFEGDEESLNRYLNDQHSCPCSDCRGKDWWKTAQACEYMVEEMSELVEGGKIYNG